MSDWSHVVPPITLYEPVAVGACACRDRTRRDDRLLLDALLFVENSIVPHLGPREAAILMSALDALLPVLQVAFSQGKEAIIYGGTCWFISTTV